jgi:hypothetical protein
MKQKLVHDYFVARKEKSRSSTLDGGLPITIQTSLASLSLISLLFLFFGDKARLSKSNFKAVVLG